MKLGAKQIAGCFLLAVLVFNVVGYRAALSLMAWRAGEQKQMQLYSNDYDEKDLISIKVPFSLPYGPNSAEYMNVTGSIEINGTIYQYVKQRFYNDSLELLCISNLEKTEIASTGKEISKLNADAANSLNGKPGKNVPAPRVKMPVKDFFFGHSFAEPAFYENDGTIYGQQKPALHGPCLSVPGKPPEKMVA